MSQMFGETRKFSFFCLLSKAVCKTFDQMRFHFLHSKTSINHVTNI